MITNTKIVYFDEPLYCESGRILQPFEVKYETYGQLNKDKSNIIVITHALSGSHHVAGYYDGDRKPGWWNDFIGDNKTIDTTKYFVICMNNIGSCFGSTSPLSIHPLDGKPYRFRFPVLTISDIVKSQMRVFKSLNISSVKAVIGGSMGGMQALCYAIEYPNFAKQIIALATTAYTRPWAIAYNKITTEAIRNDPNFKNGYYDPKDIKENGLKGLAVGRMAGHISYLSPNSMNKKFGRRYVEQDGLYELFGRFEVERYMEYNGYSFPHKFDPLSYLYIIKTMNIFNASRGSDTLAQSLDKIKAKLHLISFNGDLLFKPEEMKEIRDIMKAIGKEHNVTYKEIISDYGHDAFLVEVDKFKEHVKDILND
ncbi:Homoserine O-acetyltransferase [hydrothermal vent metagenome]|uniref:Homoserine O-acetyltransferase n=1 Tax=hydrothermal vent metagenome TaxID=652676 RepID=A0A3B1E466_9ZZZZ